LYCFICFNSDQTAKLCVKFSILFWEYLYIYIHIFYLYVRGVSQILHTLICWLFYVTVWLCMNFMLGTDWVSKHSNIFYLQRKYFLIPYTVWKEMYSRIGITINDLKKNVCLVSYSIEFRFKCLFFWGYAGMHWSRDYLKI